MTKHVIEGVVFFQRTSDVHGPECERRCKCCPGGDHVFSRGVKWDEWETTLPEHFGNGPNELVLKATRPHETEGKRVRVTLEILDSP